MVVIVKKHELWNKKNKNKKIVSYIRAILMLKLVLCVTLESSLRKVCVILFLTSPDL